MIDNLLENTRLTLGVTEDHLVKVCEKGKSSSTPSDKKIFHQIFACDNFLSFKKLMIKRNLKLEKKRLVLESPNNPQGEENKNNSLTEQEQDFAQSLSKDAFKGYLNSFKHRKDENSSKDCKLTCFCSGTKNSHNSIENSGLIDLKIKVNKAIQYKKKLLKAEEELLTSQAGFLPLSPEFTETCLSPQIESSEISSFLRTEDAFKAKRKSLKEEETRLKIERFKLEEERRAIEEEKKKLEKLAEEQKEENWVGFAQSMSILNLSNVEEASSPDSSTPNPKFSSQPRQALSFTEELHSKIMSDPKSEKLARLESTFQSLLSN